MGQHVSKAGQRQRTCRPASHAVVCAVSAVAVIALLTVRSATAQTLRFGNHREVQIPKYAVLRIGPFYSTALFTQSAGYTYTETSGTGTDYLFQNRRGEVRKDGSEFPIISTLDFRNYLLITRRLDIDMSIRLGMEYYPLGTRADQFYVNLVDEGIVGLISMEMVLTPYLRGTIYDNFVYQTDYIDTRGLEDRYGGSEYEYMRNTVGMHLDWLMAKDQNLGVSLSRTDLWPQSDEFKDQESVSYQEELVYEHRIIPGIVAGAVARFVQTDYKAEDRGNTTLQDYRVFARYNQSDREGIRIRLTDMTEVEVGLGYSFGLGASSGATASESGDSTSSTANNAETFTGYASLLTHLRHDMLHQLTVRRVVSGGFATAFETVDAADYRWVWEGAASSATLFTRYSVIYPHDDRLSEFTDWTTGINFIYPVVPYIDLLFTTRYSQRRNENVDPDADLDEELINDYDTWVTRIGTAFHITKTIRFNTYAQHTERTSDSDNLSYTRDQLAAIFTYSHQF